MTERYFVALKNLSQRFPPEIIVHEGEVFDAQTLSMSPTRRAQFVELKHIRPATTEEIQSYLSQVSVKQE